MDIESSLEHLRQSLPDPFRYSEELDSFFDLPEARSIIDGGTGSAARLVEFLERSKEPALVHVAMLLLTKIEVGEVVSRLFGIIEHSEAPTVLAMEAGFWRLQIDQTTLARELVAHASPDRPNPVLLLQRPAARFVKEPLQEFVKLDSDPVSIFAMRCLKYASGIDDRPFLQNVQSSSRLSEVRELATEILAGL